MDGNMKRENGDKKMTAKGMSEKQSYNDDVTDTAVHRHRVYAG